MERILYQLSKSKYRDLFVLKGALLFEVWTERAHRPTRDIDLLGGRTATVAEMKRVFGEPASLPEHWWVSIGSTKFALKLGGETALGFLAKRKEQSTGDRHSFD